MTPPVDVDRLPATQYLILEALAARLRLGEEWWPFPSKLGPGLRALEEAGLISIQHGNTPHTLKACLTGTGRDTMLGSGYVPAVTRLLAQVFEAEAKRDAARAERDRAIAHDRQPYPTADAYEAACRALDHYRVIADEATAALVRSSLNVDEAEQLRRRFETPLRTPPQAGEAP